MPQYLLHTDGYPGKRVKEGTGDKSGGLATAGSILCRYLLSLQYGVESPDSTAAGCYRILFTQFR